MTRGRFLKYLLYFNIIYLSYFIIKSVLDKNYSFTYFAFIIVCLLYVSVAHYKTLNLNKGVVFGLSIFSFLHLLGGNYSMPDGTLLYSYEFIEGLFRYDNLIHFFGTSLGTIVVHNLLRPHVDKYMFVKHEFLFYFLLFLMVGGMGALNEVIEFFAVIHLDSSEVIGGYLDNSIDLVFNMLGTITSCLFLIKRNKWLIKKQTTI